MENPNSEIEHRMNFLWKVIARLDFYIGTTNTKAAMITAFDVFVLGGIVIKWNEILPTIGNSRSIQSLAAILLAVAAIASLFSLWKVFQVVNPFLASPKERKSYHSDIFFKHISRYEAPEEFLDSIITKSNDEKLRDLAFQSHTIATGVEAKFADMALSVRAILFFQLPSLALLVLVKLTVSII